VSAVVTTRCAIRKVRKLGAISAMAMVLTLAGCTSSALLTKTKTVAAESTVLTTIPPPSGDRTTTTLPSGTTSLPRATTCAHNEAAFPARVWTQLVANGYMVCPVTVRRVPPFSASEAVARDVRNGAIPSTLHPLLARVGSKHGGLVGQPRHSVYWVLIDMPQLASGGPAGSCGVVAPLRGFSLDLVNANTGKWVTSTEWWPQEVSLTPAPQYRAAWQHREKAQEQIAKGVAACRRKHR
jgi:hypothetical protein